MEVSPKAPGLTHSPIAGSLNAALYSFYRSHAAGTNSDRSLCTRPQVRWTGAAVPGTRSDLARHILPLARCRRCGAGGARAHPRGALSGEQAAEWWTNVPPRSRLCMGRSGSLGAQQTLATRHASAAFAVLTPVRWSCVMPSRSNASCGLLSPSSVPPAAAPTLPDPHAFRRAPWPAAVLRPARQHAQGRTLPSPPRQGTHATHPAWLAGAWHVREQPAVVIRAVVASRAPCCFWLPGVFVLHDWVLEDLASWNLDPLRCHHFCLATCSNSVVPDML